MSPNPRTSLNNGDANLDETQKWKTAFVALHKHVEAGKTTTTAPTVNQRPQATPSLSTLPKFPSSRTPRDGAHRAGVLCNCSVCVAFWNLYFLYKRHRDSPS